MCDTFVIPPSLSESGHWIFAKNSDREPNEAQQFLHIAAGSREEDSVQTSFIRVPHPRQHYALWLSKPFHLWGGEMGINEHGLAIGNEALFTRVPMARKNTGLTGMDMIRLALERCRDASSALAQICTYTETYGQDACGGYLNRKFYYHNSFIIADPDGAYVLETAGRHWIYRRIDGFYAISNRLTIGSSWDGISDHAISYARSRKWIASGADFDFAAAYTAPVMSALARGRQRRESCQLQVRQRSSTRKCSVEDAMAVLRTHPGEADFSPDKSHMGSLCLHATGLLTPSQTTASLVVPLTRDPRIPCWATASAAPCLSLFKPFYVHHPPEDSAFSIAPGATPDESYWWQWERWHRKAIHHYPEARHAWQEIAQPREQQWLDAIRNPAHLPQEERLPGRFTDQALAQSRQILDELNWRISSLRQAHSGWLYRAQWKRWNRLAGVS